LTSKERAPNAGTALRIGVELELAFTDLLANGQGVGRAGGIVVFCFGALPGERARVKVASVKQRYAVANLVEILEPSPQRAEPFCPVFGACGGCQVQHLAYPAQLAWKQGVVREALERIGGLHAVDVRPTIGMETPRAYRNKMALVVDDRTDPPSLGFYRQRTHAVVSIDACPVVAEPLDADLKAITKARNEAPVRAMLGEARHLVLRNAGASQRSVLTVTTARRSESVRRAAPALLRDLPGLAGVANSFDLASANAILGRRQSVVAGDGEIEESVGGVLYRFSAGSFFQVNVEMVGRVFAFIEPWIEGGGRILDLYCGVGTFALFFAKHGATVYGIEESPQAVTEARANARRNGLNERARFDPGRVELLAGTPKFEEALREAAVVFLDPPRKGCDEVTLGAVARACVPTLWYLSCDPATLARDSKFLVAKGYRLDTVQPFDMFPQTGHVEILVRLEYSHLAR